MLSRIKSALFVEEPQQDPSTPNPAASLPDTIAPAMFVVGNDKMYERLVEATQFEKTKAGLVIGKYLASFATLPMPAEMKFKSAAKVAETQDGVLPADVIASFDEMKEALDKEQANFEREAGDYEKVEITQRQEKMNAIQADIAALQQKLLDTQQSLATETAELQRAQSTYGQMKTQFTMALQRRQSEVEQEKAKTSAIVNG